MLKDNPALTNPFGETKIVDIPDKVKILHKTFVLKELQAIDQVSLNGVWGIFKGVEGEIGYVVAPDNPTETVDTLIHEVLHGIVRMMDVEFKEKDDEEKTVTKISTGLVTVFKDNPQFLDAIQELLKSD